MSLVLVLGAGINGTAVARELALNAVDVVLVDTSDLASGTTAYSSRLIHGGLRYLEYGDTALVRESLAERERLLRLAPSFVRPLEFRVPTTSRIGGALAATMKLLFGISPKRPVPRGAWLVRFGLHWYAKLVGQSTMPSPRVVPAAELHNVGLASRYRTVCSYYDAQMPYPERFVAALADDARRAAHERNKQFVVHTYSQSQVDGDRIVVTDTLGRNAATEYRPDAVVNAGGRWGDAVLRRLGVPDSNLLEGTKGSHIVTFHAELRRVIGDAALYVEAIDGRPVFVLPFGEGTLVGTTDLHYDGDPAAAVASETEIDYLLGLVNDVLPEVRLARSDVTLHYAGVRPLPRSDVSTPAAISRRHAVAAQSGLPWPVWTLVGGKLTTCRQLAEDAVKPVAAWLGFPVSRNSRDRAVPDSVCDAAVANDGICVVGTNWRRECVRRVILEQYVRRLDDLVERRLMLHFAPHLERATLAELADLLVEAGLLESNDRDLEVDRVAVRLREHFGRVVA